MLTLNNKYQSFQVTGDSATGLCELSLIVPGTFSGMQPLFNSSGVITNGRMLSYIRVLAKSYRTGDMIRGVTISDPQGLLPEAQKGEWEAYPTLYSTDDGAVNNGIWMQAAGFTLDRTLSPVFLPAGMELKVYLKKAEPQRNDNEFLVTVSWFVED